MKKTVYMENVEKTIKNQIKWQKFESEIELQAFLRGIVRFTNKIFDQSF